MALRRPAACLRSALPAASSSSSSFSSSSSLCSVPPLALQSRPLLPRLSIPSTAVPQVLLRAAVGLHVRPSHQSSSASAAWFSSSSFTSSSADRGRALKSFLIKKRPPKTKLRTHAVSIMDGDYGDYHHDDADGEEAPFPPEDLDMDDDDGWDLTPADARARAEAEEAQYDADLLDGGGGDGIEDEFSTRESSDYDAKLATEALRQQRDYDALRARWTANARPKVRVREIDERTGRSYGRGGRKEATARVWVYPGMGTVTVNRTDLVDYFPRESHRESILGPFVATRTAGMFDVRAHVEGGGLTGKAEAVRHGVARALEKYNPEYRPAMKRLGYLTRDPRMVERKKVGKKKARKSPQWVRR